MTNQSNTTNDAKKDDIIIDLSQPDSPKIGSMLQIAANESLLTFLKERKERLKDKESEISEIYHIRFHQTVLIEGGRGSGKTNFLIRFLDDYSKPDNGSSNASDKPKVCILPIIDPTLIESKDHILLMIIDLIDKSVEKFQKEKHTSDNEDYAYNEAREKLAEGLVLLDGIGSKDVFGQEWEDASWAMSEGLRKASKRRNFEEKLNNYIETALKILKCEFFILSFDDVDTNFERGYMILEALRKYLTSPQLFVILSGDIELYGRLIRKNIYQNFGTDVMEFEGDSKNDISKERLQDAVSELEEQYLLKILPPQYRIPMLPLGNLYKNEREKNIQIKGKTGQGDYQEEIKLWISTKIRDQLRETGRGDHKFLSVILAEPIRLVLGYLRALQSEDVAHSRRKVLELFNLRLRAVGVPELQLLPDSFDSTLSTIFHWFIKTGTPSALIGFRINQVEKIVVPLHCLSLALADGLNSASSILRALFALALPAVMTKQNFLENSDKRKKFLNYLWQGGSLEITDFTARIGAVSRFPGQRGSLRPSNLGAVGLSNYMKGSDAISMLYGKLGINSATIEGADEESTATRGWKVKSINKKWRELVQSKNSNPFRNVIWFTFQDLLVNQRLYRFENILSAISYKYYNSSGEEQNALSALSIFAVIGVLCQSDDDIEAVFSSATVMDILPLFTETVVTNPASSVASKSSRRIDKNKEGVEEEEEEEEEEEDNTQIQEVTSAAKISKGGDTEKIEDLFEIYMQNIKDWRILASKLSQYVDISPNILGDLAMRLHDDLIGLDEEVGKGVMTGQILHRQIINILNSVIAVTCDINGRRESPKASDDPFFRILRNFRKPNSQALHPIVFILLSCPLVWAFLEPQKKSNEKVNEVLQDLVIHVLQESYNNIEKLLFGEVEGEASTKSEKERNELKELFENNINTWIAPPKINVKIGRLDSDKTVIIDGFFDLLNVVPRYA